MDKQQGTEQPAGQQEQQPDTRNAKEKLYDKLPFSYKQVDIFIKVMMALLAAVLVYAVATGTR